MCVATYKTGHVKKSNMTLVALSYATGNACNLLLAACQALVTAAVIAVLQATHLRQTHWLLERHCKQKVSMLDCLTAAGLSNPPGERRQLKPPSRRLQNQACSLPLLKGTVHCLSQLSFHPRHGHGAALMSLLPAQYTQLIWDVFDCKGGICTVTRVGYTCSWPLVLFCVWFPPQH